MTEHQQAGSEGWDWRCSPKWQEWRGPAESVVTHTHTHTHRAKEHDISMLSRILVVVEHDLWETANYDIIYCYKETRALALPTCLLDSVRGDSGSKFTFLLLSICSSLFA